MSGLNEALVCGGYIGVFEAWEVLEILDERIELRWVVPAKPTYKGCVVVA